MNLFANPSPAADADVPNHQQVNGPAGAIQANNLGAVQALLNAAPFLGNVQPVNQPVAAQNFAVVHALLHQAPQQAHGPLLAYLQGQAYQHPQPAPAAGGVLRRSAC